MNITDSSMNTKFIYNSENETQSIKGIEVHISFVITEEFKVDDKEKWIAVGEINKGYDLIKRIIRDHHAR